VGYLPAHQEKTHNASGYPALVLYVWVSFGREGWSVAAALQLHGLNPSIGTVGDAYDNALAETTIGLYKTECIRDDSPFRRGPLTGLATLEAITADWVHWYNTS
jgi:transposase InsO family protein